MLMPARLFVALVSATIACLAISAEDEYADARRKMKEEIAALARETAKETGRPTFDADHWKPGESEESLSGPLGSAPGGD